MRTRNVFFYAMYLTKDEISIDYRKLSSLIHDIFKGVKTIEIDGTFSKIYIDNIWETENYLYGRLGRINDPNSIQIRDFSTYETSDVLDQSLIDKKGLETFTYFLFDYETGIISTVRSMGAPSISSLCGIIKKKGDGYDATTKPVLNVGSEIIEKLLSSDILYNVDISHAIPSPKVLGPMGLGNDEIFALTKAGVGQSYARTVYRGGLKKPLLKGNGPIRDVVNSFVKNIQNYDKLIIEAKIEGEEIESFNLVEQFAKDKIKITDSTERSVLSDELRHRFVEIYEENKERLRLNCGRI